MSEDIELKGDGEEIWKEWLKFEKTLPFYKTYGCLSFSITKERIIFTISSKGAGIYKIVQDWIKEYKKQQRTIKR